VCVARETIDNRILFGIVPYEKVHEEHTLQTFYRVLVWSFRALVEGTFPTHDHDGVPFSRTHHPDRFKWAGNPLTSEGYIGCFSEFRADWKYLVEAFGLHANWAATEVCHLCRASKHISRLLWTNHARDAWVRNTCYTHQQIMMWGANDPNRSPLWDLPGLHVWRLWADALHVLDLGILEQIIGSAVWEMTTDRTYFWGSSRCVRIYQLYRHYKKYCRDNGMQYSKRFEPHWFKQIGNPYPEVRTNHLKGALVRGLLYYMNYLCSLHQSTPHDVIRLTLFAGLVGMDVIMRKHKRFLGDSDWKVMCECCESALLAHNALSLEAAALILFLWKQIPKFHLLTHMIYDMARQANPRRVQAYNDENMIGKIKPLVQRCHPFNADHRVLTRYLCLVGIRWYLQLEDLRGLG